MSTAWLGKRSARRAMLMNYLEVRDREADELAGRALDISIDGMRLISEAPFAVGQRFRFWLLVPVEGAAPERIGLDAESLWTDRDVNEDFFDTGFRLLDPDPDLRARLERLARDMSFDY